MDGVIKEVLGLRRFLLRAPHKVRGEWALAGLAYHIKRLETLRTAG